MARDLIAEGRRLVRLREALGFRVAKRFSEKIGAEYTQYINWETGHGGISPPYLDKLWQLWQVSPAWIWYGAIGDMPGWLLRKLGEDPASLERPPTQKVLRRNTSQ